MTNINIGKRQNAVTSTIYTNPSGNGVRAEMSVNDNALRSLGVNYDGLEKPFALVPTANGEWKRFDLEYRGSWANRGSSVVSDRFYMSIGPQDGADLNEINQRGIAFGLDVSGSEGNATVWLQGPGDNHKPIY